MPQEERLADGHPRSVSKQITLGLLANFSSLAPSMSLGFSAIALPILKGSLEPSQLSWFASVATLASPFGCFFSGPFADKYGRRRAIFFVNTVCLLGWTIIALFFSLKTTNFWLLLLGRALTGLSTGLCSSPATVYMAEISSPEWRGIFTTWASASFSLGVLVVYFLGYIFKTNLAAICFVTSIFPCLGFLFTVFLIPESPSWLVGKNRIDQAKTSICKIFNTKYCTPSVLNELESLIKTEGDKKVIRENKSVVTQLVRKISYLTKPHCLRPLGLVLVFFFFQQFSGIFVILFYAIDIVNNAGISLDPYLTIVFIGVVRFLSAIFLNFLAKRLGKRPLSIISGTGMTLCLLSLAIFVYLKQIGAIGKDTVNSLPIILLLVYIVMGAIGFLPLPFALAAELFPTKIRGTAAGLSSGIGYFFNFVTVKIYPDMVTYLGNAGVFCFYGIIALAGTIFVSVLLPETKGKSAVEIEEYFGKKRDNQVQVRLKEMV